MAEVEGDVRKADAGSPDEKIGDISIIDLLAADFQKNEETVYRETEILSRRITPDDLWRKQKFDQLQLEIGDPFFYGTIESSIGKRFYFLPVKFTRDAWLLYGTGEKSAKMMVHYKYHCIDIMFLVHGQWREVKANEPVNEERYFGIHRSRSQRDEAQVCFFIFDVLRSEPPVIRRKVSLFPEDDNS